MDYEEQEATLMPGQSMLVYSDGLVEAHGPAGEMYGFPRLAEKMASCPGTGQLISHLEKDLRDFTGEGWDQEDDVTMLVVERMAEGAGATSRELASFTVDSAPGNERRAVELVVDATTSVPLTPDQQERLKTAVAEATMNAMEHGNHYDPGLPVRVDVLASDQELMVRIVDEGGRQVIPESEAPDIEAKLAGEQSPRGWGLFLIENMVDEMRATQKDGQHILDLTFRLTGGSDDRQTI
jgi:anti-sigma regulatory factor (Ser/Thr protein kinase)